MFKTIVFCALLSFSTAATIPNESQAEITNYENTIDGTGDYRFSFDTSNGIHREEIGTVKNAGQKDEHVVLEGSYYYTDPDGKLIVVNYRADENGYQIINSDTAGVAVIASGVPASLVASLLGK